MVSLTTWVADARARGKSMLVLPPRGCMQYRTSGVVANVRGVEHVLLGSLHRREHVLTTRQSLTETSRFTLDPISSCHRRQRSLLQPQAAITLPKSEVQFAFRRLRTSGSPPCITRSQSNRSDIMQTRVSSTIICCEKRHLWHYGGLS
jgi:hypothetical protein